MRIATWNVNSVRARVERLTAWIDRTEVDVLAIQETKVADDRFPYEALHRLGYQVEHFGLSQWNGVALVSRVGLLDVERNFPGVPGFGALGAEPAPEARAIGATCGGIRMWSLYVPHGRSVGDPHFGYKLDWLAALRAAAEGWLTVDPTARIALCGDFNIAPLDEDVWSVDFYRPFTHITEPERAAFRSLVGAGFTDVVRPFAPGPGVYTYWDYQQLRFAKRQGMRIDFALCSPALAGQVRSGWIDREERKGKGASDHAPVVVEVAA